MKILTNSSYLALCAKIKNEVINELNAEHRTKELKESWLRLEKGTHIIVGSSQGDYWAKLVSHSRNISVVQCLQDRNFMFPSLKEGQYIRVPHTTGFSLINQ